MTTGNIVYQTPWRNIQGCECRITTPDWKDYSFHVGNPHNIVVSGFTSSVAANTAMQELVTALKALSKKPEPVEDVATVATVEPKPEAYTFTADEDAELVPVEPAVAAEDW